LFFFKYFYKVSHLNEKNTKWPKYKADYPDNKVYHRKPHGQKELAERKEIYDQAYRRADRCIDPELPALDSHRKPQHRSCGQYPI